MPAQPDPLEWLEIERHQPGGARVDFAEQLRDIDGVLIAVAEAVAERVEPTTAAFLEADAHAVDETIRISDDVMRRCVHLEEACFVVLARQSPVGVDLRHVVAVLRSAGDVERSGNLLRHIAESLNWVHPPAMPESLRDTVHQFGEVAAGIFAGAVDAWRSHDELAANELARRDDEADLLQKLMLTDLYTGHQSVEEAVSLALIARYYERIADHGVQIARELAYFLTGDHPQPP